MGIYRHFPYTNFHEMNLDEIIKLMREMQDEWNATKDEWNSMQEFINNYFANLDVSEEISAKINSMVADGSFNAVVDPVIIAQVVAWLNEHITPTTPALDKTLSIPDTAAESETVGIEFKKRDYYLAIPVNLNDITELVNVYGGYIGNTGAGPTNNARTMYFPVAPRQKIKITRTILSSRFRFGCLVNPPSNGEPVYNFINADSSLTADYVTTDNAKYFAIFFWGSSDTQSIAELASDIKVETEIYGDQNYYDANTYDKRYAKAIKEGLYYNRALIEKRLIITGGGIWDIYGTAERHIHIAVDPGDIVSIVSSNNATRIATRETDTAIRTASADTIEQYILSGRNGITIEIPENCHYLYITTHTNVDDVMPDKIEINGIDIVKKPFNDDLTTVYFNDFNNENDLEMFRKIKGSGSDVTHYTSVFDDAEDLVYLDSGCLNLKVRQLKDGETIDLGYDTRGTARDKISAYISTDEKFALKHGRISARIKCSVPIGHGIPWCFWTFSQNSFWAKAVEYDIVEAVFDFTDRELVIQGETYPPDSIQELLWSNTHYDNNGENHTPFYYNIGYAKKTGSSSWGDLNMAFTRNFTSDEWHVYSCEFDDKNVIYKVDDVITSIFRIDNTPNTALWDLPKDIRFNIKSYEYSTSEPQILSIDWLKIETNNITPVLSIEQEDVEMYVGEKIYINPTFNEDCTNCTFFMETDDTTIINIERYSTAGYVVYNSIEALASGNATVTIYTPNGDISSSFNVTVS